MEKTLLDYQTALDSLPEDPKPVTLPTFTERFFQTEETDAETTVDPPVIPRPPSPHQLQYSCPPPGTHLSETHRLIHCLPQLRRHDIPP